MVTPAASHQAVFGVTEQNALVKQYCTGCHSDRGKAGQLTLASFDAAKAAEPGQLAITEKMIRKLRAGMMPPAGSRRPEPEQIKAMYTALEGRVDRLALTNPNPGSRTFQRMNRAEYARAVRDMLDVDIDVAGLLPADSVLSVATVLDNHRTDVERFVHEVTALLPRLARYHEVLLIDNCSTDGAALAVQALQASVPNLRLLRLSRRCNLETAFAAALDHSIGDYVVLLEIDRDPVGVIADMVGQAAHGYDVVIAERNERQSGGGAGAWLKGLADGITYRVVGYRVPTGASYLRLLSRRAANAIARIRSGEAVLQPGQAALWIECSDHIKQLINLLEAAIVIEARKGPAGGRELDLLLHRARIQVVNLTEDLAEAARVAWRRWGKGNHAAGLNYCDCCSYALAQRMGEPLLFKGEDFGKTDVLVA